MASILTCLQYHLVFDAILFPGVVQKLSRDPKG